MNICIHECVRMFANVYVFVCVLRVVWIGEDVRARKLLVVSSLSYSKVGNTELKKS